MGYKYPTVIFNGIKYYFNVNTGYYYDPFGKRLHVAVWEVANGPVPKGWIVHHKDMKKTNNELSNLELMSSSVHGRLHTPPGTDRFTPRITKCIVCDKVFETKMMETKYCSHACNNKAYRRRNNLLKSRVEINCQECGQVFNSNWREGTAKFCSKRCYEKNRYRTIIQKKYEHICLECGRPFESRFHSQKYCNERCYKDRNNRVWNEKKVEKNRLRREMRM